MFISDVKKIVSEDIMRHLKSLEGAVEETANHHLQSAIRTLKVYDTGNLADNSQAKVSYTNDSMYIKFSTIGVDYAQYPYYGLGSSAKYGPRNYLKLGAANLLRELHISSSGMRGLDTAVRYSSTSAVPAQGFTKVGMTRTGKTSFKRTRHL